MAALITLADIRAAHIRIAPAAVRTPLIPIDPERLRTAGITPPSAAIYLKDESAQPIGSFKLRGAYNKIAQLTPEQLQRGVITYSSGNHAQGVAYAARALGAKAVIVMPSNAPLVKREATAALGAEIVLVGNASKDRKLKAEELEAAHGYTMVPPYDDPAIIAGQATCGIEILEQLPDVDLVLSPVSGGGLLSGVSTGIKLLWSEGSGLRAQGPESTLNPGPWNLGPHVFGCEPALAADAKQSFDTKTLTEWSAAETTRTLCDGLRTQALGTLNFEHILRFTDGIVTVTEAEIRRATRLILDATNIVAEPSGAITLAAALFHADELPPAKKIVAIVSGGNIEPELRAEIESEALTTTV
jgi:threo-3-hydroxy-L-aspartate ammonia-lyase